MLLVELKPLVGRLNGYCKQALEDGVGLCVSRGHYEITVEHFLVKLFNDPQADVALLLRQHGVDAALVKRALDLSIEKMRTGNAGHPAFSPLLLELMQDAWLISSVDLQEPAVRSGAVLLAFLARATYYATGDYAAPLRALNRETLLGAFDQVCGGSIEAGQRGAGDASAEPGAATRAEGGAIARFCENFTEQARAGKIDPVFGRDARNPPDDRHPRAAPEEQSDLRRRPGRRQDRGGRRPRVAHRRRRRARDSLKDVASLGLDMGCCRRARA